MSCIIISGNPVDGFEYRGPFQSADEAHLYVSEDPDPGFFSTSWWITELIDPSWMDSPEEDSQQGARDAG